MIKLKFEFKVNLFRLIIFQESLADICSCVSRLVNEFNKDSLPFHASINIKYVY